MTAMYEEFRQSLSRKSNEEMIQIDVVLFSEKEDALMKLTEFQNVSREMAIRFQQMKDELMGTRWRKMLRSLLMKAVSPVWKRSCFLKTLLCIRKKRQEKECRIYLNFLTAKCLIMISTP